MSVLLSIRLISIHHDPVASYDAALTAFSISLKTSFGFEITGLTRSAFLGEVWRAGYPLGVPPRNLYFAQVGRLRRPIWAKKKILGGGFTAPKPPPPNSCERKGTWLDLTSTVAACIRSVFLL